MRIAIAMAEIQFDSESLPRHRRCDKFEFSDRVPNEQRLEYDKQARHSRPACNTLSGFGNQRVDIMGEQDTLLAACPFKKVFVTATDSQFVLDSNDVQRRNSTEQTDDNSSIEIFIRHNRILIA